MAFPSIMIAILLLTRSLCASKTPKCAKVQQKLHKLLGTKHSSRLQNTGLMLPLLRDIIQGTPPEPTVHTTLKTLY